MKKLVLLSLLVFPVAYADTFLGPTPYLSFADSPFNGLSFSYFYLETFEDHLLNTPGVTGSPGGLVSVVFGPSAHDSVDADDGAIDGSGLAGDNWFSSDGGVTFTFNAGVLGSLPTHVGIVWTDGAGQVTFRAYGPGSVLLGTIGPVSDASFPDGSNFGTTAEDRFFGIIAAGGISSIFISNSSGGIEVDHLQYGFAGVGACAHHTVHGHISTVPATHSGTFAQHHGTHGHTVAAGADCPPHAPGHSPGLTSDAGEGFFSSNPPSVGPDFVAAVDSEGGIGPAKRGAYISLFGSARGLYLDEQDAQSAANFTPPAGGAPLYHTTSVPEVLIHGLRAKVLFSGLAPGLTGVWQINVLVPEGTPSGKIPVQVLYDGALLKSTDLEVQ